MAPGSSTVTLTFAANTKPLQQGFKDVESGAARTEQALEQAAMSTVNLGDDLENTGRRARGSAELFRGVGDASLLMGSAAGATTQKLVLMSMVVQDLGKGAGRLLTGFGEASAGITLMGAAVAGVTATLALLGAEYVKNKEHESSWSQFTKDGLAGLSSAVGFVTQGVPVLGGEVDKLTGKLNNMADAAHSATVSLGNVFAMASYTNGQAPDTISEGGSFTAADAASINSQLQSNQDSINNAIISGWAKTGSAGASAASKALTAIKQAAQQKLSEWQSMLDKFRGISQGIRDALSPKLEAGDKGLMLFPGLSLLDKLKKQLADTLHLQRDIAALGKAGLNGDLLGSLVQGGLSSLPAADELLAGGKGEISAVNKTASGITKAGGTLAGNEAMRQLNAQKDVKVKIDVTGGENDLKKLIRKWVRVDGGGSVQLALGGK